MVLENRGGEEDVKTVHAREKSSWWKLSGNFAVGDGVFAVHSDDAATGINGNSRGGHPRGCCSDKSAVSGSVAAATGGKVAAWWPWLRLIFDNLTQ